jgi:hypothetical protein
MSGLEKISELVIPSGYITDLKLDALLQTLAAKHGLSDDELVSCFYRKNCKNHSSLLDVRYDNKNRTRGCGHDPYYSASLIDENGEIVPCPVLK